jgi:hypothetical protein
MSAERINGAFQTAGVLVETSGESNPKKAVQGYAQMVVSASGTGLTSEVASEGNIYSLTGATVSDGSVTIGANNESIVVDTMGFEGVNLTVSGFGAATIQVQWSNLPASGFVAGSVSTVGSGATATSITANGQYAAASGGRYLRIITTAYVGGTLVVTPTFYASGSSAGGGGGGGAVTIADGADVALGAKADAAWASGDGTLIALGKATVDALNTPATELPPMVPVASSDTDLTRVTVSISSATTTSIVSATTAQSTRAHRIALTVASGTAQTITFQSASTVLGAFDIPNTGGSIVFDYSPYWWFKTANNEAFQITTSSAAAVKGIIDYVKGA